MTPAQAQKDSKTTYAKDVLQPYVDNGQLAGAISVFYKDGVQETCCVGYADVAARRRIKMDNAFMRSWRSLGNQLQCQLAQEGTPALGHPERRRKPALVWSDG